MESMDNVRERFEALAQQTEQWKHQPHTLEAYTRMVERRALWCGRLLVTVLVVYALASVRLSQAAEFVCATGDVTCLIDKITTANANGEINTITLRAGSYTLTAANNVGTFLFLGDNNGLPIITSPLTIRGARAGTTVIEQGAGSPGLRIFAVAPTGTLTLRRLTVRGGGGFTAVIFGGGLSNTGMTTIDDCTFAGNVAPEGGGLFNSDDGTLLLTNSTVTDNVADLGSGIENHGTLVVINSTLHANGFSFLEGGGLLNSGTATLINSTITDNFAGGGGGIANGFFGTGGGTVVLLNTLLARNSSRSGGSDDCAGQITSLGYNLVGDLTGCTIILLPTDLTGDPGLGDFTDNGRPGRGHVPLLSTSQAIDAANDAVCPRRDQLGQRRVNIRGVGTSICDIGAIEFRPYGEDPVAALSDPEDEVL